MLKFGHLPIFSLTINAIFNLNSILNKTIYKKLLRISKIKLIYKNADIIKKNLK